jgi:hypothetical protein
VVGHGSAPLVMDDPFTILDRDERSDLLATLAQAAANRPVVLLADDPDILSWAISLPEEIGAVTGLPVAPDNPVTSTGADPSLAKPPGAVAPSGS